MAAPDYVKRHGRPRHPGDLIKHECFGYVLASRSGWAFLIDGKTEWFPVAGRLEANSGDALLAAAIGGVGITHLPTFIVEAGRARTPNWTFCCRRSAPRSSVSTPFSRAIATCRIASGPWSNTFAQRIGHKPPWDEILPNK